MPTDALFRDDLYYRSCEAVITAADDNGIVLDHTVFYPTNGRQPDDTGQPKHTNSTILKVVDTVKGSDDAIIHKLAKGATVPPVGVVIQAENELGAAPPENEHAYLSPFSMHTCLHLMTAVTHAHITGAQLTDEKGRIDFDLPEMTMDKMGVQTRLNQLISEDHPVGANWVLEAELDARSELIKTMSVRPPVGVGEIRLIGIDRIDVQPCGGTHVDCTGEIGGVSVQKIESKGMQNRGITVVFAYD